MKFVLQWGSKEGDRRNSLENPRSVTGSSTASHILRRNSSGDAETMASAGIHSNLGDPSEAWHWTGLESGSVDDPSDFVEVTVEDGIISSTILNLNSDTPQSIAKKHQDVLSSGYGCLCTIVLKSHLDVKVMNCMLQCHAYE